MTTRTDASNTVYFTVKTHEETKKSCKVFLMLLIICNGLFHGVADYILTIRDLVIINVVLPSGSISALPQLATTSREHCYFGSSA